MVEVKISDTLVEYPDALEFMQHRVHGISNGTAEECLWFLEHPPLYTAGTSARAHGLLEPQRFPVFDAGRGGQYTYHGPGQRVIYLMLNLNQRGRDIRQFVTQVEDWIIATLARFNIRGYTDPTRVGVWVDRPELGPDRADKIAAIGIRVKKWVTFHGLSLNIDPDLEHFSGIVPCGIADQGVTSMTDLGHLAAIPEVDQIFLENFETLFGTPIQTRS